MTRDTFLLGLLALVFFAFPFGPILTGTNADAVYQAIAADTYYYLKLASGVSEHGFPTFDGRTVSNGYMPLWQLVVVFLDLVTGDTSGSPEVMVRAAFLASFGFAAFGLARISAFVAGLYGMAVALVFLPFVLPGAFFWFFQNVYWIDLDGGLNFGVHAWSFANGMESGVCLTIFSLVLVRVHALATSAAPDRSSAFILGALCFLAFMGRLDDVFLGVACGFLVLGISLRQRDFSLLAAFVIVPLAGTSLYLAGNYLATGVPLPSSGLAKVQLFPNSFSEGLGLVGVVQGVHVKFLPILVAMMAGVAILLRFALQRKDRTLGLEDVLGAYLLLKAAFLFTMVPLYAIGNWYFTDMIAAMNLLFVMLVAQILRPMPTTRVVLSAVPFFALATFAMARNVNLQLELERSTSYTVVFRQLCQQRDMLFESLQRAASAEGIGDLRIIDTADGAYAYCLGLPALGVTGLGDSAEFLAERQRSSVFEAAASRGHVFVGSSPVDYAAYPWQETATQDGYDARRLFSSGDVEFWIVEKAD